MSTSRSLVVGLGLLLALCSIGCAGEAPVDHDPVRDTGTRSDTSDDDAEPLEDADEDTGDEEDTDPADWGDDAGSDTEPGDDASTDGGLVCSDSEREPNDSIPSGIVLKAINDCDSSGSTFSGVVAGSSDVDYWTYQGTDQIGCVVDPTVENETEGVRVCVYASCKSGPTNFKKCKQGTPDSIAGGSIKGCCVYGPGEASMDFTCTLLGTSDSADVYMRVDAPSATACVPYEVKYHF